VIKLPWSWDKVIQMLDIIIIVVHRHINTCTYFTLNIYISYQYNTIIINLVIYEQKFVKGSLSVITKKIHINNCFLLSSGTYLCTTPAQIKTIFISVYLRECNKSKIHYLNQNFPNHSSSHFSFCKNLFKLDTLTINIVPIYKKIYQAENRYL